VKDPSSIFAQLMAVIEDRKANRPEQSYTTRLLSGGVEKIGAKIVEEAAEVVAAAGEPGDAGRAHATAEAVDLIYHLFVLLSHRDIPLAEVEAELARRFGISGLDEKAARGSAARSPGSSAAPSIQPPTDNP
jgi:phosphoribosyl-ATP pyrophosphohydrolase